MSINPANLIAFITMTVPVVVAAAAAIKFLTWGLDRTRDRKLASAAYFKEKGSSSWETDFGAAELRRMHFAELTGIDRPDGHEAIIRLHARLGGGVHAWSQLRACGHFLLATGHLARIQKAGPRDRLRMHAASIGSVAAFITASAMLALGVQEINLTDWTKPDLRAFTVVTVAALYAALFFLLTWGAFRYRSRYFSARALYRRIAADGKRRRSLTYGRRETPVATKVHDEPASAPPLHPQPLTP